MFPHHNIVYLINYQKCSKCFQKNIVPCCLFKVSTVSTLINGISPQGELLILPLPNNSHIYLTETSFETINTL